MLFLLCYFFRAQGIYMRKWEASELTWSHRWDVYLKGNPDDEIHYFSIVNSLMIVLFLTGVVAMIMLRTLHQVSVRVPCMTGCSFSPRHVFMRCQRFIFSSLSTEFSPSNVFYPVASCAFCVVFYPCLLLLFFFILLR